MAGRRHWGRVRKLPSGRYQARYPGPDGTLYPAPYTFQRKTDANDWLTDKEAELRRNGWQDPNAGKVKLEDYGRQWLQERPELAPRTIELYESLFRLHLVPNLGTLALRDISAPTVRKWRAELLSDGVGKVTVAKSYRLLGSIMRTAVADGEVRENPCQIPGAGQHHANERRIPEEDEVSQVIEVIGDRWEVLVLMAALGALRFGELAALRRRDLDLTAMTVKVSKTTVETGGTLTEGPPKSEAGRRLVHLPAELAPVLRTHLDNYSEAGTDGRVFIGAKGGPLRRSTFGRIWRKAVKEAGIEGLHFHDLRHAGGTWAAQAGATLRELQERLGHSTSQAAMVYQHAVRERDQAVAQNLAPRAAGLLGARGGHDEESDDA